MPPVPTVKPVMTPLTRVGFKEPPVPPPPVTVTVGVLVKTPIEAAPLAAVTLSVFDCMTPVVIEPAVAVKLSVDEELTPPRLMLPVDDVSAIVLPPVFRSDEVTVILPAAESVAVAEVIVAAVMLPCDADRFSVEAEVMTPAVMLPVLLVTAMVPLAEEPLWEAEGVMPVTVPAAPPVPIAAVPIWALPPPPERITVGAEVYPVPAATTVKPVIAPLVTVAVAVAPVPPPPTSVTVGAVV